MMVLRAAGLELIAGFGEFGDEVVIVKQPWL
jgi:hypothetical protein